MTRAGGGSEVRLKNTRKGEKIGWTGGWLGSFLWLWLLGLVWLAKGRLAGGGIMLGLGLLAGLLLRALLPWKHPEVHYWKLMVPLYGVFALGAGLAVYWAGGWTAAGMGSWSLLIFLPILMPLFQMGRRRWMDGEAPAMPGK